MPEPVTDTNAPEMLNAPTPEEEEWGMRTDWDPVEWASYVQFTVEDPETWAVPWTGEYAWPATTDLIYEYACHEGNYALGNILRGARLKDTEDAAKKR